MTIRKVKGLESDFTIVPNQTINDKLSWAARGMLLYLCSKPDDWEVSIADLVSQTTGTAKRSGCDAVRKIMDELVTCGYMRKTQKRIAGKFQNNDHEVSFLPFTENPYTANPSTVNPTQQSKDCTKKGLNKPNLNHNRFSDSQNKRVDFPEDDLKVYPTEKRLFLDQLSGSGFNACRVAMEKLKEMSSRYDNIYTGPLTAEEWARAESALMKVLDCESRKYHDDMTDNKFIEWIVEALYLARHTNKSRAGLTYITSLIKAAANDNQNEVDLIVTVAEEAF